jgi:hypothetical protein
MDTNSRRLPVSQRITLALRCPKCGEYTNKLVAELDPRRYVMSCRACNCKLDLRKGENAQLVKELKDLSTRLSAVLDKED